MLKYRLLVCLSAAFLFLSTTLTADDPAASVEAKLSLANGDFVAGKLVDSDQPETLRWQAKDFATPFSFSRRSVTAIHFPGSEERPVPTGEYCFELAGGDLVFGSLVGLSEESVELNLPLFGKTDLSRASLRRILRWGDGADLLYLGPNGLLGWDTASPGGAWREDSGHLVSAKQGAFIHNDFKLPAQAAIEFELSWDKKPDFALALGVEKNNLAFGGAQAFRFEVWQNHLVAMRETDDEADVASLKQVAANAGRVHLIAYLDQEQDRMFVVTPDGKQLADLQVANGKEIIYPGIRLTNHMGTIRLERLRISRWNGELPRELEANKSRLHRGDGSIVYGEVKAFDAAAKQFVIAGDDGEARVAAGEVGSIVLAAEEVAEQTMRVVLRDGTRLSGTIAKVTENKVLLRYPGMKELLSIPFAELHTLLVLNPQSAPLESEGRAGRLELANISLKGVLGSGEEGDDASCLAWRPHGSANASPLLPGVAGRVIYREPPPPTPKVQVRQQQRVVRRGGLLGAFVQGFARSPSQPQTVKAAHRALHLRTGDTIPCEVERIDEKGVTFKTEMTDATFVAHEEIKAIELNGVRSSIKVDKAKRERLLTLPRMQRNNPPTHLIRSTNGDYLRARIDSLDENFLTVEVRLEQKQLKRGNIAEIIWLHQAELGSETKARNPATPSSTYVQAVRSDGTRLTFHPKICDGQLLAGESELLGRCQVDLKNVDVLLIGQKVQESASQLAFGRWRLTHAVDPKFVAADGSSARPLGTESDMVGKPAPDFTLELLTGKSFQLSRQKGKVVVLDFWATWCGPCIQAMPQVDRVVEEFKDHQVELVAVNLQEAPDKIKKTLERLKLDPAVALDIDGVVAGRYAATAIPQTVIVDREGNVARLFVGGGSDFADQLRTALQNVVGEEAAEAVGKDAAEGAE